MNPLSFLWLFTGLLILLVICCLYHSALIVLFSSLLYFPQEILLVLVSANKTSSLYWLFFIPFIKKRGHLEEPLSLFVLVHGLQVGDGLNSPYHPLTYLLSLAPTLTLKSTSIWVLFSL